MSRVFIGSVAVAEGRVTKHQLARKYQRVLPDVYAPKGALSLHERTLAAWEWSRGRGVVSGLAASALHGSKWIDADTPIELNLLKTRPPAGVITTRDTLVEGEVTMRKGLRVTSPERTAFDLARRYSERSSIERLDALARATGFGTGEVVELMRRHPRVRGRTLVEARLAQVDSGAESPKETALRLTLIRSGFPRPQTQIPVRRPRGRHYFLDMGWPEQMVAVEYDGEHHRTSRSSFLHDVERAEYLASVGWIVIRVLADHRTTDILERVRRARAARG